MFRTALSSPYPPQLCVTWGQLVAEAVALRAQSLSSARLVPTGDEASCRGSPLSGPRGVVASADQSVPDPAMPFVQDGGGSPKGYRSENR